MQKGCGTEQIPEVADRFRVFDFLEELDESNGPFMDTAALMTVLDLVITSDTSIAHLAGALGVPVWVALPLPAEWRRLQGRDDSPWYPTMRLFRQTRPDDWASVFQRMAEAIVKNGVTVKNPQPAGSELGRRHNAHQSAG